MLSGFVERSVRYKTGYKKPSIERLLIRVAIDFHRNVSLCSRKEYQCSNRYFLTPTGIHTNFCQKLRIVCLYCMPKFEVQNRKAPYSKSPNTDLKPPVLRSNLNLILTKVFRKRCYMINLILECCSETKSTSDRQLFEYHMTIFLHPAINMSVNLFDEPFIPFRIFYAPF